MELLGRVWRSMNATMLCHMQTLEWGPTSVLIHWQTGCCHAAPNSSAASPQADTKPSAVAQTCGFDACVTSRCMPVTQQTAANPGRTSAAARCAFGATKQRWPHAAAHSHHATTPSSLHTLPAGSLSKKQQINPGTQKAHQAICEGFAANPEPDVAASQHEQDVGNSSARLLKHRPTQADQQIPNQTTAVGLPTTATTDCT
jgi:hypothetical protein